MNIHSSRRTAIRLLSTAVTFYLATSLAVAGGVSFTRLGNLGGGFSAATAFDVSADGSVVVGYGFDSNKVEHSYRWSTDGNLVVYDNTFQAYSVTGNGQLVVGAGVTGSARWTAADGVTSIPNLPANFQYGYAHSISMDGASVVGEGSTAGGPRRPYRWTSSTGMVQLGTLPGKSEGYGLAVSGDGLVAVGHMYTGGTANDEAFRWTAAGGMKSLGYLSGHPSVSYAGAASHDGSIVVGSSGNTSFNNRAAFRWTQATGMKPLGSFPGGNVDSAAFDISGDGSIVVGIATSGTFRGGVFWNSQGEIFDLKSYLVGNGATNLDGWTLWLPHAVSHDGRTIVGEGINPDGKQEAWMAIIPEPSTELLTITALVIFPTCRRKSVPHNRV